MTSRRRGCRAVGLLLLAVVAAGCGDATGEEAVLAEAAAVDTTTSTATSTSTTTSVVATTAPTAADKSPGAAAPSPAAAPPAGVAGPRPVTEQPWAPFATAAGVTLHYPSNRVERIGFHQSGHDGARMIDPLPGAAAPITLEDRGRLTGARTAADVVVDPAREVRSPVSGRVLEAGSYTLYCDYTDDYVFVAPDEHPGWIVKIFHISGVQVASGGRVAAGQTVIAPRPHQLPFPSQVDEVTSRPAWPHVHVEVVDPTVPDRPTGGGC